MNAAQLNYPHDVRFRVWPFRFHFAVADSVFFPQGKASNVIRGAFGTILRKLACLPQCAEAKSCDVAHSCPYALLFEPRQEWAQNTGPSGLADWPRPFVFRALHLDGRRFGPGEEFYFDVVLFEPPAKVLPYFVLTFRQLAESGFGPARGRALLTNVEDLANGQSIFDGSSFLNREIEDLEFSLDPGFHPADRLTLRFLTPTELKSGGEIVEIPEFAIVFRRLRDRISNLRAFYQGGPLVIDFEALAKAAEEIQIVRSSLRQVESERQSSRTGQRHPLGGFVGEVEYQGDLSRFLAYLKVGEWTGVGRQTVWGKGCFAVTNESSTRFDSLPLTGSSFDEKMLWAV